VTSSATSPLPSDQDASGRSFGSIELDLVRQVLESGALTSTRGTMVRDLETGFATALRDAGATDPHVVACASGTAAIHAAVAVVDPEPGEEVVTTSITDIGGLTPLLYQGAVPVFADVDPLTGNVTAASVQAVLSERTRAVVVTHLFGNPADLDGIRAVCAGRGIPVIEDSAQSMLGTSRGRPTGAVGDYGCFSLQQGKHITCGEGGLVVLPDAESAHAVRTWVNKSWPYGDPAPDHRQAALNYRLSELQGAVALGQLGRLADGLAVRRARAAELTEALQGLPGLTLPSAAAGDVHAWWRYPLLVDPEIVPGGPVALGAALKDLGVPSAPRYIVKPAFRTEVFARQKTFGGSRWPFSIARPEAVEYDDARFPGTLSFLARVLVLPWNERYLPEHVERLAGALRAAVELHAGVVQA